MRSASSYRSARKQAAKEIGVALRTYNKAFDIAARQAENPTSARQQATEKLAIWARNGGRETAVSPPDDLAVMNRGEPLGPKEHEISEQQAEEAAKKITTEDVDKAMESALSKWQADRNEGPMPLTKIFAARARALGWVEDAEFYEEK